MNNQIKEMIDRSELVLIGIGEEFTPDVPKFSEDPEMDLYYRSRFYAEIPDDHEVIRAYNSLRDRIGDKSCFVVTLNTDDLIYRSEFDPGCIAAPCGSMGKLQCSDHITDGSVIRDEVLKQNSTEAARCPECGRPLHFHTIRNEEYLEKGYLPQWEKYKLWLSGTLNRKLCVLELGVGVAFPQVIRWPFEKTVLYNKKAEFARVNSRIPQVEAEIADRALSLGENPVHVLIED